MIHQCCSGHEVLLLLLVIETVLEKRQIYLFYSGYAIELEFQYN